MIKASALAQARRCLKKMEQACEAINASTSNQASQDPIIVRERSLKDAERKVEAWRELLVYYCRFYNKLKAGCRIGPSKGWFDRLLAEQRDDDLLRYMLHARNALEHGLSDGELVQFFPKPTTLRLGARANPPTIVVDFFFLKCVDVVDRGVTYQAPTTHLGTEIENKTIQRFAQLAVDYVKRVMAAAEAFDK
jgi:hypothetical protein